MLAATRAAQWRRSPRRGAGVTSRLPAAAKVDRFDDDRAWAMLEYQVDLGPRPAGSATSRKLAAYIKARLPGGRYETLPGGLRNVVGEIPGEGKPILLAAHYDTKDIPGFVGANDGAGGTAALLELARALQRDAAARGRAADPLRRLRRRGGHRRPRLLRHRPARLQAVRAQAREGAARGRAARLRRRQGPRDPARGQLGPRDVGRPARGGRDGRLRRRVPGRGAGRGARRPHAVRAPRRAVDRPDRLHLPLLARDLRRPRPRSPRSRST